MPPHSVEGSAVESTQQRPWHPAVRAVWLALAAGSALFTALIAYEGVGAVASAVATAGWGLLAVTAFHLVPVTAAAVGWHQLIPRARRPPLRVFLLARWVGEAINDLLPVAGIGGNVAKALVVKWRGCCGLLATASVVVDVTLVVATQSLFTAVGLILLVVHVGAGPTAWRAGAGAATMILLAVAFVVAQRRGAFARAAHLFEQVAGGRQFAALAGGARALDAEVKELYRQRRRVAVSAAWHAVQWLTGAGEVWLALYFLGHPVTLLEAVLLESLGQAVRTAAFAVPAGIGVQEGGFLALGTALGIPPHIALALSLVKRVPEIALGLPGLLAWQGVLWRRRDSAHGPIPPRHVPHPLVRLANRAGRSLQPMVRLDADELIERATRRSRLDDFGEGEFRQPLEVLLRSYDEEAQLTLTGRLAVRMNVLRLLEQRLQLEDHRKRNPGVAAQEIRSPLFIISLSRAGTTLLHRLLAQDPGTRTALTWELMFPMPPPQAATYECDPRIARADRELRMFDRFLAPHLGSMHEVGARLPEECLMIMAGSFRSFQFPSMNYVPSYQQWMESNDLLPGYAYHRRVLQHLQSRHPGDRWVLKAPAHIFGIDEIFATYPDARIVHMHRDPLDVAASLSSLTVAIFSAFAESVDRRAVGRDLVESLHSGLERYFRARDRDAARQRQFLDIDYRELTGDPLGSVRRLYDFFEIPLADTVLDGMQKFLAANPKGKLGEHRYALEDFGIDRAVESRRFQYYCERFGISAPSGVSAASFE